MNAKYISIIALLLLAIGIFLTWFRNEKTPTIDSLRAETQEAIKREEEATKARMEREDNLSQALYLECFNKATSETGSRFENQQKEAYECWRTKTNWTGKLAPASEPPLRWITSNPSSNVTNKSTVWSIDPTASRDRSQIHATIQAQWKQVAISNLNRWKVPKGQILPQSGKTGSKGKESNCLKKTILRNGWNDPRVQFAYDISCWNMDFIKTIEAESRWDVNASWDSHKAFWLCQINKLYNPEMQKQYRNLKSDNEKVSFCYGQYQDWVKRWVIKTRLYGYNKRNLPTNSKPFTFK